MNSTAEDIANILNNESSLGLTLVTDLFYNRMPDEPSIVVTVYDNPGGPPALTMQKDTSDYYFSSISVQVRDNIYDDGWDSIFAVFEFLHGHSMVIEGGTYYALIKALDNPQVLHYDENDRPTFVVNFEVQRRGSSLSAIGSGFSSGFSSGFK